MITFTINISAIAGFVAKTLFTICIVALMVGLFAGGISWVTDWDIAFDIASVAFALAMAVSALLILLFLTAIAIALIYHVWTGE